MGAITLGRPAELSAIRLSDTGPVPVSDGVETVLAPSALGAALAEQRISTMFLTSALFTTVMTDRPDSFAGARYVDVHVRSPGLAALSVLSVVSALACVAAPQIARRGYPRRARLSIGVRSISITSRTGLKWLSRNSPW